MTPRLRFSLKPSAKGWDEAYWRDILEPAYIRHEAAVTQDFLNALRIGKMLLEEAESTFFHEICVRVSGELQLTYVREEN